MTQAKNPLFFVGFSTGWNYPDGPNGIDPSDSPAAHRMMMDLATGWTGLEKPVADAIVEAYNGLQETDQDTVNLDLGILMKPFYDIVSEEKIIVSKNGDLTFEARLGNEEFTKDVLMISDVEKGAKALSVLYAENHEALDSTVFLAHLCDAEDIEEWEEAIEDHQEPPEQKGIVWIAGNKVLSRVDAEEGLKHAVTVDGRTVTIGNRMCRPYQGASAEQSGPSLR